MENMSPLQTGAALFQRALDLKSFQSINLFVIGNKLIDFVGRTKLIFYEHIGKKMFSASP